MGLNKKNLILLSLLLIPALNAFSKSKQTVGHKLIESIFIEEQKEAIRWNKKKTQHKIHKAEDYCASFNDYIRGNGGPGRPVQLTL